MFANRPGQSQALLRIAEMESDLKRKQSLLDQLELLTQQLETAALEAGTNAFYALDQTSQLSRSLLPNTETVHFFTRTKAYVEEDNHVRMCSNNTTHIQNICNPNETKKMTHIVYILQ